MSCFNRNCSNKNPTNSINAIHVGDGDFVCNEKCKAEYESQKKEFFDVIVHSEELTTNFLLGK